MPDCCTENPQAVAVATQLGQLKLNWTLDAASISPQSSASGKVKAGSRDRVRVLEPDRELPYTAVFTVKAKVWLEVADGRESASVSEREETVVPCTYARNEPRTISQPAALTLFIAAVTFCCFW